MEVRRSEDWGKGLAASWRLRVWGQGLAEVGGWELGVDVVG